jgi:hypothetical protein
MANKEHLKILQRGVEIWNQWRKDNPEIIPDLSEAELNTAKLSAVNLSRANLSLADLLGANFSRADLSNANLGMANLTNAIIIGADLSEADLDRANLRWANLVGANLEGANLSWTNLGWANLGGANLGGVNLRWANLRVTNLSGATLIGTNLEGSILGETIFADTNLKDTKSLDKCRHEGPSTIDHRTLQKSGPLPLEFLRGCGLPDNLIDYLPSLLSQPWQYYSCFISYSSKDKEAVRRLYADLQDNGVRCWLDEHDMKGGKKTYLQIDEAIRIHDRVLLVLSENSIKSEWVMTEIRKALALAKSKGQDVLFPIRLVDMDKIKAWECFDSDTGVDLAKKVRDYFIPDFQNWKDHSSYKQSFERLLGDLKSTDKKPKSTK